jgi:ubiquinone/menaquinone biosynthesis C-methylase UbiE
MKRQPEPEYMDGVIEAEAYALSDFSEVNRAFVERLLELVGETESLRALDLGTGPGDIPVRVSLARPEWRIVGVDASEAMLRYARESAAKAGVSRRIEWVCVDAGHTKLPAHSFDAVFANSILHHINETEAFWAELKRVAKPGATVLLRDLFRPETIEKAREIVATYGGVGPKRMQEDYYRSLLSAYTPEEAREQLSHAGLTTLEVRTMTDRHMDVFGRLARPA